MVLTVFLSQKNRKKSVTESKPVQSVTVQTQGDISVSVTQIVRFVGYSPEETSRTLEESDMDPNQTVVSHDGGLVTSNLVLETCVTE